MGSNNPSSNPNPIAGAITYPSRNEDVHRVPIQPRQPRNLQGLLRFAMEATKAEDAPGNSDLGPMDEERRKFLEEALKSLTVDLAKVMQDSIKVLSDTEKIHAIKVDQPIPEDVRSSFNNLLEFIDDIDVANDFQKLGGFAIFPVCYGCENPEVRALASSVLAELCQNNPYCQTRVLEVGLLNVLLNLLGTEQGSALAKCLYAVSCACREFTPACRELTAQGGCAALATLLRCDDDAARTKVAFFIRYLCYHHEEAKVQFIKLNIVRQIAEQIKSKRDNSTEHLLNILLALSHGLDSSVIEQFQDPSVGLKSILEKHLTHPDLDGDTFVEERHYCQQLLKVLDTYPSPAYVIEEADR